jgi:hypothetical protein
VYTSYGVWPRDHYNAFPWLPPISTCSLKFYHKGNCNHSPLYTPSSALWFQGVNCPWSPHISIPTLLTYIPPSSHHHLACTNWYVPLTRLGRAHTWLMMTNVHPWWLIQEPVLNMIQVTYQTRQLLLTHRHSLNLSVNPQTQFSNLSPKSYLHFAIKVTHISEWERANQIKIIDQLNSQSKTKHGLPIDTSQN